MQESLRVSVADAAKELGMAPETVRWLMLKGTLPIGSVVKSRSGKQHRCLIYRPKLNAFLGKSEEGGRQQ